MHHKGLITDLEHQLLSSSKIDGRTIIIVTSLTEEHRRHDKFDGRDVAIVTSMMEETLSLQYGGKRSPSQV